MAERFFTAGYGDSIGTLLMITADSVGYNYAKHMRVRNNLFFRLMSSAGFFDNEAPFPETVAAQMRQYLIDHGPISTPRTPEKDRFKYDINKSKIIVEYDNGLLEEQRYSSDLYIRESIETKIMAFLIIVQILITSSFARQKSA